MFMKDFTRTAATVIAAAPPSAPVVGGILAGTLVETATGWRGVETLQPGDRVQTLDGGLAPIRALDRRVLRPGDAQPLVAVAGGAFDTCTGARLLPGQPVAVDTLGDPELPDAAYVLLPAQALAGHPGCSRHIARAPVEVITPFFADEEILWANSGLLLHCPGLGDGARGRPRAEGFFPRLDLPAARALLARRAARLAV